jgi:hypothetical protein
MEVRPAIAHSLGLPGTTVTLNEQEEPEVLATFTVVVPNGKKLPEAGDAVMVPQEPEVCGES